jgi:hypothetical protein
MLAVLQIERAATQITAQLISALFYKHFGTPIASFMSDFASDFAKFEPFYLDFGFLVAVGKVKG